MSKTTFRPQPNRPFDSDELEQLAKLAAIPDDDIDTDDAPEITEEGWRDPRRPGLYKPVKQPVTIRLDADVVEWFKAHAEGKPYQTEINSVLRRHVAKAAKHRA
jgi:uncharacterized protein (DUF4415 family)